MKHLCPVYNAASQYPSLIAIRADRECSYKELNELIEDIQKRLDHEEGEKVACIAEHTIEYIAKMFACWRNNLVFCPINKKEDRLVQEATLAKQSSQWIRLNQKSDDKAISYKIDNKVPCLMLMTSGSSSEPKVAVFNYENLFTNAKEVCQTFELDCNNCWQATLPFFHIGGIAIALRTFISNSTLSFIKNDPETTHLSFVPTQLYRYIQKPVLYPKLQKIMIGGARLAIELFELSQKISLPLALSYGCTEASSQILLTSSPQLVDGQLFLGQPRSIMIRIDDQGEIHIKGKSLFMGYWIDGHITPPFINGWFATKDRAFFNEKYGYTIIGRMDEMIISGGENIQPSEIEKKLLECPGVFEAFVLSLSDPEYGQKVVAFVEGPAKAEKIKNMLYAKLPRYKIPKEIISLQKGNIRGIKPTKTVLKQWLLQQKNSVF